MIRTTLCLAALVGLATAGCATKDPMSPAEIDWGSLGCQDRASPATQAQANLPEAAPRQKLEPVVALAMLTTGDKPRVRLVGAEQLAQWDKAAQGCAGITGFRPISPMLLGDKRLTLNDLRSAAEMMRCERLMVVAEGRSEADNFNHAAALYWTFVGLWLVPGNVVEHRAVMQAMLVDVPTGAVLGVATGESRAKQVAVAAFKQITEDKLRQRTSQRARARLMADVAKLLETLKPSASDTRPAM